MNLKTPRNLNHQTIDVKIINMLRDIILNIDSSIISNLPPEIFQFLNFLSSKGTNIFIFGHIQVQN